MKAENFQDFVSSLQVKLPSFEKFINIGDMTALFHDKPNKRFIQLNYERGLLLYALISKFKPKNVLEIGTASGMLTAVLSAIYNRVYSLEINKEAYDFSSSILKNYSSKILLKLGDGKKGWKEVAPFDAIYIDSCVTDNIVELLKDQLNENGILVFAKKYLDKQFYCLEGKKNNTLLYKSVFQVNRTMLI